MHKTYTLINLWLHPTHFMTSLHMPVFLARRFCRNQNISLPQPQLPLHHPSWLCTEHRTRWEEICCNFKVLYSSKSSQLKSKVLYFRKSFKLIIPVKPNLARFKTNSTCCDLKVGWWESTVETVLYCIFETCRKSLLKIQNLTTKLKHLENTTRLRFDVQTCLLSP